MKKNKKGLASSDGAGSESQERGRTPLREPPDIDAGCLEVGRIRFEVVINYSDLTPDRNGVGHIVFSPRQARNLARLLLKHADEALREYNRRSTAPPSPSDLSPQSKPKTKEPA